MIIGMSVATFTLVHVLISLVGIVAGVAALREMIVGRRVAAWNTVFLITTIATSVTGFLFHSRSFGPPHVIGVLSLMVLWSAAVFALKGRDLKGGGVSAYVDRCDGCSLPEYLRRGGAGFRQAAECSTSLRRRRVSHRSSWSQSVLLIVFAVDGFVAFRRFAHASPTRTRSWPGNPGRMLSESSKFVALGRPMLDYLPCRVVRFSDGPDRTVHGVAPGPRNATGRRSGCRRVIARWPCRGLSRC